MKNRRAGFTLLEVMLTLGILASILAMIYGILYATLKTRQKVDDAMGRQKLVPALFKVMEEDFTTAFLPNTDSQFFVGKDQVFGSTPVDRIDFVAARTSFDPETQSIADLTEVGYQLKRNDDFPEWYRLLRREDPFVDNDPLTGGTLTELHDKVISLDVRYFDGKDWLKAWDSKEKKGLPQGVRIDVTLIPVIGDMEEAAIQKETPATETVILSLPR